MRILHLTTFLLLGITATTPATSPDPIGTLIAKLNASHGLWINGMFPSIQLPPDATTTQVITEAAKANTFGNSRITDFQILSERPVELEGSGLHNARAVHLKTNLGEKIFLFANMGDHSWWTRFYDVEP